MSTLFLMFELRFVPFVLSILLSAILAVALALHPTFVWLWVGFGIAFFFLAVGVHDLCRPAMRCCATTRSLAHIRFLLEAIRPEMRQYFFEGEKDGAVQPRQARGRLPARQGRSTSGRSAPSYDVYEHRLRVDQPFDGAAPVPKEPFRITIGGPDCTSPTRPRCSTSRR